MSKPLRCLTRSASRKESERRTSAPNPAAPESDDAPGNDCWEGRLHLQDVLSQHKRNPFSRSSASQDPVFFQELVEYGYDALIPRLINAPETEVINPARQEWRLTAQEDAANDHAHLATIADLGKVVYRGNNAIIEVLERIRLRHQTRALSSVRKTINQMHVDSIPTDKLILAVLNLSFLHCSGNHRHRPARTALPPAIKGLLFAGQARKNPLDAHARAMKILVDAKGGLEEIKLAKIAEFVLLWDLRRAVAENRPPYFPILEIHQKALDRYDANSRDPSRLHPYAELGDGFQILAGQSDTTRMLKENLVRTAAITREFRALESTFTRTPKIHALINIAWITHHQLLSLPANADADTDSSSGTINFIYAATRTAALIYHSTVVCPITSSTDVEDQLAEQLREAPSGPWPELVSDNGHIDYRDLMLWVLLMGSIAATFSKHRKWFITQLRERGDQMGVDSFSAFQSRMSRFLWFENMTEPATKAWLEGKVENIVSERERSSKRAPGLK
ncbi:hypothetical protein H2200_010104 [Cladophialophora chaetospira]|uniref:Uncharacterized protein n=1 Tax=Cladophialophora chaetospira TaxID=386627 RepID=A0AA38X2G4_9EURO|nr:hypothetical protein H2200_010104 [Cladophialophora chaetospira]